MLQEQTLPIDFGQGLSNKTDPKLVVPGKMLRLENAVFTKMKRIQKRNGYVALSTSVIGGAAITNPVLTHNFQSELLCNDKGRMLTYSPSDSAWAYRGEYISTEVSRASIDQIHLSSGAVDTAILGNYALYGWSTNTKYDSAFPAGYPSLVYGSLVDLQTGSTLLGPQLLSTPINAEIPNGVRCVLLGGTVLGIFYLDPDNSRIVCRTVSFSGVTPSFSAEVSVSTNLAITKPFFDVAATATGGVITYLSTTGVTVSTISTSGAVVTSLNTIDADAYGPVALTVDATNGNIWGYWNATTFTGATPNGSIIKYSVYSSVMALVLAATNIATLGSSPYIVTNMIALSTSTTQQTLFYGQYESSTGTKYVDATYSRTVTSAGVIGANTLFAYGVVPFSHPINVTAQSVTDSYAVFLYRGASLKALTPNVAANQPTYFLVRLTNIPTATGVPVVAARFGSGVASAQILLNNFAHLNSVQLIGYTPNLSAISATKLLVGAGIELQDYTGDNWVTGSASLGGPGGFSGSFAYSIDFDSAKAYRPINVANNTILNGGVIQAYDGQGVTELNFHLYPEIPTAVQATVFGGFVANGTYSYLAIFQWLDNQGNMHQSAPSIPVSVTTTGANNAVTLTISRNYLSQKKNVSISIYRTQASGSIYYLVTDPIYIQNGDATASVFLTYTDTLADASLSGNPQAYTYPASAVLENGTPPPSMAMVAHTNRLWFVDSESPNTIWYTKSISPLVGISPSPFMLEQIDPKNGAISALAEMDEKLVILKENGIVLQIGDGVNDTGSGSTLSTPQNLPSNVGCSNLKSVILTAVGVMFSSPNGIYLVGRDLNVVYIGMDVEDYNAQTITSAKAVTGKSQIRFLVASGSTLLYDYQFNQWSVFTNHAGKAADNWLNTYVYATASGAMYQESSTVYTDNGTAYSVLAQTSWLSLASVQGFERVRRLAMLGDYANGAAAGHGLQIQAAYDFSTTFQTAIAYTFGAAASSGVFQYRERLAQQKCDTISLLIQEVTTGNASEYVDFTDISFEAGIKKGLSKLGTTQTVS